MNGKWQEKDHRRHTSPHRTGPRAPGLGPLGRWARDLLQTARTAEHPFNAGLMQEALVSDAQKVLNSSS